MEKLGLKATVFGAIICAASPVLAQGDPTQGKREFRSCRSCHQLAEGRNSAGPSLYGMFGATAGQVEGFRYSDAMTASGIVWDEETVDAFITNPEEYLEGTTMAFRGLANPQKRADLIAYLMQETAAE